MAIRLTSRVSQSPRSLTFSRMGHFAFSFALWFRDANVFFKPFKAVRYIRNDFFLALVSEFCGILRVIVGISVGRFYRMGT